jgi:predicted MFS family arabinose efflux permease
MTDSELMPPRSLTTMLLPFALIVFLGYSAVGIPLSTLPVHVHAVLGYGTTVVGILIGLSAVATLLTRQLAGAVSDRYGPKFGVLMGLGTTAFSGAAYLVSLPLPGNWSLAALAIGRLLLGLGDSLFTTGIMAWAVTRVGPQHAGRAMAWIGIAMYGALAVGAPLGAVLGGFGGFATVSIATGLMPLLAMPVAAVLLGLPGAERRRVPFLGVVRAIWAPGIGMVLASAGFGTIAAFLALLYAAEGWSGAGLALTGFGAAYILARLLFGSLPDRMGGSRVALVSLAVEAVGLLLIASASQPMAALLGTVITGLGYSMVFPSLGVEAVRRVPAESRGVALGVFLACFDLGLGAGGPAAGLVAGGFGLPAAFVAASVAALVSLGVVWASRSRPVSRP